jgi:hypothetical protein
MGSGAQGFMGSGVHGFNSRFAVFQRLMAFNPHFMGFKHLTSFDFQSQLWGFQLESFF